MKKPVTGILWAVLVGCSSDIGTSADTLEAAQQNKQPEECVALIKSLRAKKLRENEYCISAQFQFFNQDDSKTYLILNHEAFGTGASEMSVMSGMVMPFASDYLPNGETSVRKIRGIDSRTLNWLTNLNRNTDIVMVTRVLGPGEAEVVRLHMPVNTPVRSKQTKP